MGRHPSWLDLIAPTQVGHKRLGRGDLSRRRRLAVHVPDQADPDSVFIDIVSASVAAMDALLLVIPPPGDFDDAVTAAVAVPDDEVVSAALEAEELAVLAVDLVIVAAGRRAMVQDDITPGPIGLVGVEQLAGARTGDIRLQPGRQPG